MAALFLRLLELNGIKQNFWNLYHKKTNINLNNIEDRLQVLQIFASLDPSIYEGIYFARPEETEWREKFSNLVQPIKDTQSICTSNISYVNVQPENPMYQITDLVLIGQTACISNKSIGIATIGKQCSISMWYRKNSLMKDDMEQMLARVMQILEKAVLSEEALERYYA